MTYINFKLDIDADGIVLITWDAPGRSMNVIDLNVIDELSDIVEMVAGDRAIRGAVITSGKAAFCAGADLIHAGSVHANVRREVSRGADRAETTAAVLEKRGGCGLLDACRYHAANRGWRRSPALRSVVVSSFA